MKRDDFLEAARTLASEHGLGIIDCLRRRGWTIASEVAEELAIHISTATKDLSSLHRCGLLERRKGQRKTRPAYEYRLAANRIVLDIDLADEPPATSDETAIFYLSFFERLFAKARRMGWHTIESQVVRELGDGTESVTDITVRELKPPIDARGAPEVTSATAAFVAEVRRIFVENLGESATARLFEATAKEEAEDHPGIRGRWRMMTELGVRAAV